MYFSSNAGVKDKVPILIQPPAEVELFRPPKFSHPIWLVMLASWALQVLPGVNGKAGGKRLTSRSNSVSLCQASVLNCLWESFPVKEIQGGKPGN